MIYKQDTRNLNDYYLFKYYQVRQPDTEMYIRDRNDAIKVNDFKYFIVDTDCGGDDSQALLVADYYARTTGKKLLGITTCDGNAFIEDVVKNVLIVQSVCKSSYPVYRGIDSSIGGQTLKDYFFGKDGLGETQAQFLKQLKINTDLVQKQPAYKFIAQAAQKHKGQIAIVCLGPLTNLALAYHYNNDIAKYFSNVSLMGCSDTLAGLHSFYTAEFNVGLDPEAAYAIFEKFSNIIVSSLDTTCFSIDAELTKEVFLSNKTPKAEFIRRVHVHILKTMVPHVIDPLAVFVIFKPDVVTSGVNLRINIEVKGHRTRGCSIVDYFSPKSHQHNIYLINSLDPKAILSQMWKVYQ